MARGKSITKELAVEKAIEMAKRDGIDSVTYNQLARELGIRPQSLYRYVDNIREVRVILLRTFLGQMVASIRKAIEGKEPREALYSFSEALYDISHRNPCYYESLDLMHQYGLMPEMKDIIQDLMELVWKPASALKPEEADRYTQMVMALNIGYAHMAVTKDFPLALRDDREAYLKSVKEFIDRIF